MLRTIIVTLSGVALLALTACGNTAPSQATVRHDDTHTTQTTTKKLVPGATHTNFDRIQLAIEPGDYPSTVEQVRALLGKPTHIDHSVKDTDGQPLTTYVWEHPDTSLAGAIVSVSFRNGTAVAKNYQGAQLKPNQKVTPAILDRLTPGTAYQQVTDTLGIPNRISNWGTPDKNVQTVTYSNIKNRPRANVTLTFQQNQLTATARTAI